MFCNWSRSFITKQIFLQIQFFRGRIEDPIEMYVIFGIGNDFATHMNFFSFGHTINCGLIGFAEWFNCKERYINGEIAINCTIFMLACNVVCTILVFFVIFTFNIQIDGIADTVSFRIMSCTSINSRVSSCNFLQNQASIWNDYFLLQIMR